MAGKASLPCSAGYPATQSSQGAHSYISTVELGVLRACNTALSGGAYSEAVGGSERLARSTEGFLTEVSNVLREAEALL